MCVGPDAQCGHKLCGLEPGYLLVLALQSDIDKRRRIKGGSATVTHAAECAAIGMCVRCLLGRCLDF